MCYIHSVSYDDFCDFFFISFYSMKTTLWQGNIIGKLMSPDKLLNPKHIQD